MNTERLFLHILHLQYLIFSWGILVGNYGDCGQGQNSLPLSIAPGLASYKAVQRTPLVAHREYSSHSHLTRASGSPVGRYGQWGRNTQRSSQWKERGKQERRRRRGGGLSLPGTRSTIFLPVKINTKMTLHGLASEHTVPQAVRTYSMANQHEMKSWQHKLPSGQWSSRKSLRYEKGIFKETGEVEKTVKPWRYKRKKANNQNKGQHRGKGKEDLTAADFCYFNHFELVLFEICQIYTRVNIISNSQLKC